MTSGRNEFKLKLNMRAIATISDFASENTNVQLVQTATDQGATFDDIRTIEILHALLSYMEQRHCDPGFEMVINER